VIAAKRSRAPKPSSKLSMTWGCLKTSWPRSRGVYGVNTNSWAKSLASCFLPCLAVAPTPNSAGCGAGTKIWCAVKAASRNVNRPQTYRCLVSL
jgi:hypothetical protein